MIYSFVVFHSLFCSCIDLPFSLLSFTPLNNEKDVYVGTDCPFGEWEVDMKDHTTDNLEEFRKEGKYRLHLDKAVFRGTEVRASRVAHHVSLSWHV